MTDSLPQSPLMPPSYLTSNGNPHKHGILVDEPPVCLRCSEQPESAPKLEQHVRVTKTPSMVIKVPKRLVNQTGLISLSNPLEASTDKGSNGERLPQLTPTWMSLLPSSRKPFVGSACQYMLNRCSTSPGYETTQFSTPFTTRPGRLTQSDSKEIPSQEPSPTTPVPPSHRPPIKDPRIDPLLATKDVSQADSEPGRRDARYPRGAPGPVEHHPLGPDRGIRGQSPPHHLPDSNSVSTTADQEILQVAPFDRSNRHSFSQQLFNRSNSFQRRRFSIRKIPTASTIVPAGSCGIEKSHSPTPSQDISPARAPLLRELSSFFATRAGK